MNLTRYQVEVAVFGMRQAVNLSALLHARVRPELIDVLQQLDDLLLVTSCEVESESVLGAEELRLKDPINVAQAAEILECSRQWVRQIAKDLGGRWAGSSWVFDRQTVLDYVERRKR